MKWMHECAVWMVSALVGACAPPPTLTSAPLTNHGAPPSRPTQSACPLLAAGPFRDRDLWLNAVFPQCPAEPFEYWFSVCGAECPRPCRVRVDDVDPRPVHFDARGRWVETVGEPWLGCTYEGDRLKKCWRQSSPSYPKIESSMTWHGDHLRTIENEVERVDLVYESDVVVRMDLWPVSSWRQVPGFKSVPLERRLESSTELIYDEHRRLIREDLKRKRGDGPDWVLTTTYAYDDEGRVTSRRNDDAATHVSYRKDGRVERVDSTEASIFDESGNNLHEIIQFAYDDAGRLVSAATTAGDWGFTRTYEYTCQ